MCIWAARAILNRVMDPVVRCHVVCRRGERIARAVEVNDAFVKKCDNCIRPPLSCYEQSKILKGDEDITLAGRSDGGRCSMKTILIVDDDSELCSMLREFFRQQGFGVESEPDGVRGLSRVTAELFDLLILDVMLPGLDGFQALQALRKKSHIPVLMLTARGERGERIQGLELGADDYLPKPFDPQELLARVRAILRRAEPLGSALSEVLVVGELRLLPGARDVSYCGEKLALTAMECDVLEQLMRSCGRVVSRDQLSLHLYSRPATAYDRSIDTHVSRIRRKMRDGRNLILSVRGTGYQLCHPSKVGRK
jgi:two-component system response regulator CpxR